MSTTAAAQKATKTGLTRSGTTNVRKTARRIGSTVSRDPAVFPTPRICRVAETIWTPLTNQPRGLSIQKAVCFARSSSRSISRLWFRSAQAWWRYTFSPFCLRVVCVAQSNIRICCSMLMEFYWFLLDLFVKSWQREMGNIAYEIGARRRRASILLATQFLSVTQSLLIVKNVRRTSVHAGESTNFI